MKQSELVCLCRAGFEKELASELNDIATAASVFGYVKTQANSGFGVYICSNFEDAEKLHRSINYQSLTFIRHWFISHGVLGDLGLTDRATPIANALEEMPRVRRTDSVYLDTNEGKSLNTLSKAVVKHVDKIITTETNSLWVGQVLFLDNQTAYVGASLHSQISPWPSGILHLRVPRSAPSRATLKLEEAWHQFVPKKDWEMRLAPSMTAVDLGAAPGGWTWQLVNKHMFVQAIDNGPMDESLMESGQVTHHRSDGFVYTPSKTVDWLVCDIADKPSRVTSMIIRWAKNRWFREAVFNLKLPMKQRYVAVSDAKEAIAKAMGSENIKFHLRIKQLYHDREEVTAHLRLFDS